VWYRLACHLHYNLGHLYARAGHPKALKHLNKAMSMLRSLSPPHPNQHILFPSLERAIAPLSMDQTPRNFNHIETKQPSPPPHRQTSHTPLHRDRSRPTSSSSKSLANEEEEEEEVEGAQNAFNFSPMDRLRNRRKEQQGK
jgi:hypothetical protein